MLEQLLAAVHTVLIGTIVLFSHTAFHFMTVID
jgi:hypothetical protein